jgi:hypothetical protein
MRGAEMLKASCRLLRRIEAAKQFGQEDDITVISITRTAALEPAAA